MSDILDLMKIDLLSRLPEGAFVRFSRDEDSLFVTDAPRRFPAAEPPGAPWRVSRRRDMWFCAPERALTKRLCGAEAFPDAFPDSPAGRFAALLWRLRESGEADGDFTLVLLRTLGKARLGQKAAALLPPLKSAYARALAARKTVRTAETALIALETALVLESSPGPDARGAKIRCASPCPKLHEIENRREPPDPNPRETEKPPRIIRPQTSGK